MATIARPAQAASVEPLSRRRRIAIWTLIVLASIIAVVGILTSWVKRQMLDNTEWNKATIRVIHDPQVQTALSTYIVNQLYDNVNVQQSLEQRLPENAKSLAGPLAAALQQPATNTAKFLLTRPRIQNLIVSVSTVAHQKLVNVLENKTGYGIDTGNGKVTLNLHDLVVELGTALGLPSAALEKVPVDAGVITIMDSDQLSAAQAGVQAIHVLSTWLLIAVLVLYALAIYLAHGVRRVTLRNVGWALVIVGLIILIVRRAVGNYIINTIASESFKGSVHAVWIIGTSILGQIGTAAVIYGILTIFAALLAGPSRWAVATRRWLAPHMRQQPGLLGLIVGIAFLLVVLWGPTYALRVWWGILIFAVLIAAGVYELRRRTLDEFPQTA